MGLIVNAMARFAVPFFFMISGYYCFGKNNQSIKKKIYKLLKITVTACLVYMIYQIVQVLPDYQAVKNLFSNWFTIKSILKLSIFNGVTMASHLWFMIALLSCYILMLCISKTKGIKAAYIVFFLFLVLHLIIQFIAHYYNKESYYLICRNFWFTGAPFFLLGHYMHKNQDKFIRISNKTLFAMIVVGEILSVVSIYAWGMKEIYAGTIVAVIAIFCFSLKYPQIFSNTKLMTTLKSDYTSFIYIYHPLVISVLFISIVPNIAWSKEFQYIIPIFVCIITTILAFAFYYIKNLLSKHKKLSLAT
jgi:surface polysaccharide O-acyltransferase-like enzyme